MSGYKITQCVCCGQSDLDLILDLNEQAPANFYTRLPDQVIPSYPLALNRCTHCWHAQLSYCVNRQEIFDDYSYVSGTSQTLTQFFDWFAGALAKALPQSAHVLEIAANDGSFIKALQKQGVRCLGVDPAENIVIKAKAAGLPITCGYWPQAAEAIDEEFDAIVCMNVLAHVDDPFNFLAACKQKLKKEGMIIIQASQARMFENGEFDTIYHEHISFFNTRSIQTMAQRLGLQLSAVALVKVHGDSPVYFLQHSGQSISTDALQKFYTGEFAIDEDLYAYEKRIGLFDTHIYYQFAASAQAVISSVQEIVARYRQDDYDIVFVGAAAKAITLLNAAGLKPDYLLDESPLKIGLYAPGCGNLVASLIGVQQFKRPALFVLSAWNFRYELTDKLKKIGVPEGSRFFAYFPTPQWIN